MSEGTSDIRVITAPTVEVIARPAIDFDALARWIGDYLSPGTFTAGRDGEFVVEAAGRACYWSWTKPRPGGTPAYIDHILESGHGSVLEHPAWTLAVSGISRTLTHQWIRHRAGWAYSEYSQRFVDASDVAFVVPPALLAEHGHGWSRPLPATADEWAASLTYADWRDACRASLGRYRSLLAHIRDDMPGATRKEVMEAARSVLNPCAETRIVASANARALRHACQLRGSLAADREICRLFVAILRLMQKEAPLLFGDFRVEVDADGREYVASRYHKV